MCKFMKMDKVKVPREGVISFYVFIISAILPFCFLSGFSMVFMLPKSVLFALSICLSYGFCNILFLIFTHQMIIQVVIRASFLGSIFSAGVFIAISSYDWRVFGWYMCVLSFFHYSEYLTIALSNPKALTVDAFMLNHSLEYGLAAASSWIEFFIEYFFFPELKQYSYVSICGLALCIMGEILRKLAMFTASTNFNHVVQTVRERDHILVTRGVYSLCRHPSYVGWFYWSVGTQVTLVNPVCIVIYTIASWTFFKGRVLVEEAALLDFFGEEYVVYKKRVGSGLPFNDGVQLNQ